MLLSLKNFLFLNETKINVIFFDQLSNIDLLHQLCHSFPSHQLSQTLNTSIIS